MLILSCFSVKAQVAAREFGLASIDDGSQMTLTGGLMYNGGPGANTAMHGLAALVPKLRQQPGSYGLVYANGGLMANHSVGIYSTRPFREAHNGVGWSRQNPCETQRIVNQIPRIPLSRCPQGLGKVQTYTVMHTGTEPVNIAVVGVLVDGTDKGKRFIANMPITQANLRLAMIDDLLGRTGRVTVHTAIDSGRPQVCLSHGSALFQVLDVGARM